MLLFYFIFSPSLSPFLLIYLHMSTMLASSGANITLQCLIATKKGKTQSLPRTHEQARDHSILSLGPSLSDCCTKGENVVEHVLEGRG